MISYLQVFKATSFFGGVQVVNIVIAIIRSKCIAIFLGPAGMGIFDLLTSTISLIGGCTSFGLGSSAIRDISAANATSDENKIATTAVVIKKLVWYTGFFGFSIALLLSPWLSFVAFKSYDYTLSFAWVSLTLLFSQLTTGQMVVLQGLRKHKYLALAGIVGNFIGAICSILLYYFYSTNGIVPAIISASLISMIVAWYYSNKSFKTSCQVSSRDVFRIGKSMLQMGFYISLSWLLSIFFSYIVRIFISQTGSVEDLGLYGAGFALINTYVGLIFEAMTKDYYPRLASVAHDDELCCMAVNQQAEIALLIITPILIFFLVFLEYIILLLYSEEFSLIQPMVQYAALGMIFKTSSWAIGYIFLAKGDRRTFFVSEFFANIYTLFFNIFGYYYFGLEGLGISFLICYLLIFIQVFLISKFKYNFNIQKSLLTIFIISLFLIVFCFIIMKFDSCDNFTFYKIFIVFSSVGYSIYVLNNKINFRLLYSQLTKKL